MTNEVNILNKRKQTEIYLGFAERENVLNKRGQIKSKFIWDLPSERNICRRRND